MSYSEYCLQDLARNAGNAFPQFFPEDGSDLKWIFKIHVNYSCTDEVNVCARNTIVQKV